MQDTGCGPNTHVILMGILPWGLINQGGVYVWPNQYTQAIGMVNKVSRSFAQGQQFVHYVDCGHLLFPTGQVGTLLRACTSVQ